MPAYNGGYAYVPIASRIESRAASNQFVCLFALYVITAPNKCNYLRFRSDGSRLSSGGWTRVLIIDLCLVQDLPRSLCALSALRYYVSARVNHRAQRPRIAPSHHICQHILTQVVVACIVCSAMATRGWVTVKYGAVPMQYNVGLQMV